MEIAIHDWTGGKLTDKHGRLMDGTEPDALRVAGEIFSTGANVMLVHKSPTRIEIHVDEKLFQQR
jgi:hypothetical protein